MNSDSDVDADLASGHRRDASSGAAPSKGWNGRHPMLPILQSIAAQRDLPLHDDARILDFGCGLGRHVRELRARGYAAFGVDLEEPKFTHGRSDLWDEGGLLFASSETGRFPFEDASFDICFSTSTLEHVMDYETPMAEISRVLRPGGYSVHFFPAGWRPIEPHTSVPFGGKIHPLPFLRACVALGVRPPAWATVDAGTQGANAAKADKEAVTDWYRRFFLEDVNYLSTSEIARVCRRHFSRVEWIESEWIRASQDQSKVSRLVAPYLGVPGVSAAYRSFHTRAILLVR